MNRAGIGELLAETRPNAALAWLLLASVLLGAVRSVLRGDLLWGGFAASVAALSLCPPVLARSGRTMLPWEVLALAALPVLGRAFLAAQVGDLASYLAVAALALVVAIDLHVFTTVEMNRGFAVGFVVIATMATAGLWALARWVADLYLETGFLASEAALMWEFVASTAAGVLAGVLFAWYVGRGTSMESARSARTNSETSRADGEAGRTE